MSTANPSQNSPMTSTATTSPLLTAALQQIAISTSKLSLLAPELEVLELLALKELLLRERSNESWIAEPGALDNFVGRLRASRPAARLTASSTPVRKLLTE